MSKIVVMDSGFGGLTVLSELRKLMPDEEYIFYGDSANAPYGEKTHDELRECTFAICRELSTKYDIKCFVIACNTTSSEVWDELTAEFDSYDFIGIEPALKQAAEENNGKNILVLATTATTKGRRLRKRYEELKTKANISLLPAPGIVPYVEGLKREKAEFKAYLAELLKDYRDKTDCVVLGCTHFPFVKEELREALGNAVVFYDAAANVAEACKVLVEAGDDTDLELVLNKNVPVHIHEVSNRAAKDSKGKEKGEYNSDSNSAFNANIAAHICDRSQQASRSSDIIARREKNGCGDIIFLNSDPEKVALEEELLQMYAGTT